MAQTPGQLRLFDDEPETYQRNVSFGGLKKVTKQIAGNVDANLHAFAVYDNSGNKLDPQTEEHKLAVENYYFYKTVVLAIEFFWFLYFLAFGMASFALVVVEVDFGSGWILGYTGMIGVTATYAAVGAILLCLYYFFSICFVRHGDEQLDELYSNMAAILAMYGTGLGLLISYFTLPDTNNEGDDLNFRRLLHTVLCAYGVFGTTLILRSICRHMTVEREIMIHYQRWKHSDYNEGTQPAGPNTIYEVKAKPHNLSYAFMAVMWLTTAAVLALVIWILVITVGASSVPDFRVLYITCFSVLGVFYGLLTATWIAWSLMTKMFKRSFSSHFDVFYVSHVVMMGIIVFMLAGYRYVYWNVPDTQFEDPGVTIPALKLAFFNKLAILILSMLPLFAMGISKGCCLMANEWPLALEKLFHNFGPV